MTENLDQDDAHLEDWIKKSNTIERVVKLPGDASTRRYYRVFRSHPSSPSFILMSMEAFIEKNTDLPFLTVQKHLSKAGVDVPLVLDVDPARGYILLEDLSDVTLLRKLQEVGDAELERHLYERVIDSLVQLQYQASPKRAGILETGQTLEAFSLRFDYEKLMWEMNFMIEHFYQGYLGRLISAEDEKLLRGSLGEICQTLADEPTVFTHRDFHSRNIMVTKKGQNERFVMIDFQDARMGPAQYDLASLLKDSYYQLDERQIERLLDYYIARWEAVSSERLDRAHFVKIFDLMSVQRNLKAIGSFASFLVKRNNPGYLKYIGNTFENVRRALLKYPEYTRLREVLFHYYYF